MSAKCRICLTNDSTENFINIFEKISLNVTIIESIIYCSSIKVFEDDLLPKSVCENCVHKLNLFNEFRELIKQSDKHLKLSLYEERGDKNKKVDISVVKPEDNILYPHIELECIKKNKVNNNKIMKEYNILKKKTKTYECKDCNKIFRKADHYKVHMTKHTGEKTYACEFCPKRFARHYVLLYHRRIHTKEKPYKCEVCSKAFRSPSNYYVHKKIHNKERKYKCKLCTESFHQLGSLNVHIRKHTGERPYLCEMCSSTFRSNSSLLTHQMDIHGKKKSCPICNKSYSNRVLKEHIHRHKEKELGLKRYNCDLCGKNFTCASSKKKHLLIHSGEKPFCCEVCKKSFNQRSALKTHMKVHSDFTPFACNYCNKSFKYKHHLKSHISIHHDNIMK